MSSRVVLIRGINVGGKNKVSMADLRSALGDLECTGVSTYLNSGNAIVDSTVPVAKLASAIEGALPAKFALDDGAIKVLVLTTAKLQAVIDDRPKGFGDRPAEYFSDAIFLMDVGVAKALESFDPREGVDTVWPGDGVVYHQRLTTLRTKTNLGKVMATPAYKSMTIRSWSTTLKLAELAAAG